MDRQGYEQSAAGFNTGSQAAHKPVGERIMESVPGTHQYQATHGTDALHQQVEKAKAYIPGTEENRMRQAGVTDPAHTGNTGILGGTGGAHHTHGTAGGPTMGQRIKEAVPGTAEYEATHGMTGAHQGMEQLKGAIPGTEEHRIKAATHPGTGGFSTHDTGAYQDRAGYQSHDAHHTTGTGGLAGTAEQKPLGQKIKEHIPGTREHEAKKVQEGRF